MNTSGKILFYLKENREKEIYSKNIEKFLKLQKSWVSTVITQLERADLISRHKKQNKKIILITESGLRTLFSLFLTEIEINIIKAVKGVTVSEPGD